MKYTNFDFVRRYGKNPILSGKDFPPKYKIHHVFNSGVTKTDKGYIMVCCCEDAGLRHFFWVADSADGIHFRPRTEPVKMPNDKAFTSFTDSTFYDPRVTALEGKYYLLHAAHSHKHSCRLSLLETKDFDSFNWRGFVSEVDNRNGVLFPEKINGCYCRFDRPNLSNGHSAIWVSYSPDLIHWGRSSVALDKSAIHWCYNKIGGGAVPIKTKAGWLNIFHGVRHQCQSHLVYQLGVALHDLECPEKVISYSRDAILAPEEDYEIIGQAPTVVFTCGAIAEPDGEVKIYYGGADRVQCLATTTIDLLLDAAMNRV